MDRQTHRRMNKDEQTDGAILLKHLSSLRGPNVLLIEFVLHDYDWFVSRTSLKKTRRRRPFVLNLATFRIVAQPSRTRRRAKADAFLRPFAWRNGAISPRQRENTPWHKSATIPTATVLCLPDFFIFFLTYKCTFTSWRNYAHVVAERITKIYIKYFFSSY